jgi:hypothetical protein|tara:strand:+ start:106 stop:414 length:309 start_codon:yes stop_codon:yes gene_type:complete
MGLGNKKVNVDIDGDGIPDLNLDLKTIIMVLGGVISLTMTYSTLTKQIELNRQEIEIAKTLPPAQSHDIIDQKILYLEEYLEKLEEQHDKRIDQLEIKVYKR